MKQKRVTLLYCSMVRRNAFWASWGGGRAEAGQERTQNTRVSEQLLRRRVYERLVGLLILLYVVCGGVCSR